MLRLVATGIVACALVGASANARAGADPDFLARLTDDERAWLASHPTVRIAFDRHFPPYSFEGDTGELEGFAVDVVALLAGRTGLTFDVSPLGTWQDLYAAAQRREVDVVATMVRRREREQWFEFTKPYVFKSLVIMTRADDPRVRGRQNLAGKTLAVVAGYQYVARVFDEFPTAVPLQRETMLEALNAVSTGQADAAIAFHAGGQYVRTKYLLTNLEFRAIYDRDSSLESFAVRNDWPLLRSILDKALESIPEGERLALERKWLPELEPLVRPAKLELTERERAWIQAHPVIRLGVDPEFRPFEFIDDQGVYRGHAADYVALLNERLGLNMEVVPGLTWQQATAAAERGDVDVLPCVGITADRQRYLAYSDGYIEFQRVIITRTDTPFMRGIQDLADLRVAVQAKSSHAGFLRDETTIEPRAYATLQQALLAVSTGESDALVGNIASAAYWIRRLNLTNLKVAAAASDEVYTLHFAVRRDWPELLGILQKGLASISDEEKEAIAARWVVLQHDPQIDHGRVLRVALIAGGLLLVALVWNLLILRGRRRVQRARDEAVAARDEANAANAELERMKDELEDLVRSRTAEWMESEKKFQQAQKMEALGTLVGGIAHDFNNVLTGMLGSIFVAQSKVRRGDQQAAEENLELAHSLGFRGADLIKQLLAFARKSVADKKRIDVAALVGDVVPVVEASLPSTIQLDVDADVEGVSVVGNAALLQQAVLNVVNNARDALATTSSPRIDIGIRVVSPAAAIREQHPELTAEQYVVIEVADNGEGMSEATMKKIFDPFFTTKPPGAGTGLGLPMVFGAVRDHGGAIDVASVVGEGARFAIYLPVALPDEGRADDEEEQVYRGAGQTVLLAEDAPEVLAAHAAILTDLGYEVLTAGDGAQAVALVEERGTSVDLAILDVVMPKMDGIAAAREIRRLRPDLKIVFLTAHDFARGMPERLQRKDETLLIKPCTVAALSRTVHDQLRA